MVSESTFLKGSAEVWDEVFEGVDTLYSETPITQNQLFEHQKIGFLEEIFPKGKLRMLEVGCGSAFISLYFAKKGYRATCLDINSSVLEIAKNNFKKEGAQAKFIVGNAEKLPFKANTFDLVTSFGLLEHFNDPALAISEMVRVIKPGGLFFADIVPDRFSCQTFGNFFNFFASTLFWSFKGKFQKGLAKGMRNFKPLYFENSLNWRVYKSMIEKAGVKKIKVYGNRPFPRLTLPQSLDKLYTRLMKPFVSWWIKFDRNGGSFSKFWGAGWWFWGRKK